MAFMIKNPAIIFLTLLEAISSAWAGNVSSLSYSATNVTTSAYVTQWASTPTAASHLQICDTSGQVLKIAVGAATFEFDIATVQVSGCVVVPIYIAPNTRISLKAISASATTGYNTLAIF